MSDATAERWLPVVGYEGFYGVSDFGRVRSLPHWRRSKGDSRSFNRGRILKPSPVGDYLRVGLSKDGRARSIDVHRLVAAAFIGPCPPGQLVRHLDGDGQNNTLANLAYGTPGDNELDKVRHGRHRNAQKTHCPQGHEYAEGNVYMDNGSRKCRACHLKRMAKYREKQRLSGVQVAQSL